MITLSLIVRRRLAILLLACLGTSPFAQAETVCPPKWGDIEVLHPEPGYVESVGVGIDRAGNILAAYSMLRDAGERLVVYAQRRPAGGQWQQPEVLFEHSRRLDPTIFSTDLKLSVGPRGHALLVLLRENRSTWAPPRAIAFDPASGWGAWTNLGTSQVSGLDVTTAVNEHGVGIVILQTLAGDRSAVHYHPQGGWGQAHNFPQSSAEFAASLDLNDSGQAVLTWSGISSKTRVVASMFNPLSGWTTPTPLASTGWTDYRRGPQAAIDAAGNAFVTWSHKEPTVAPKVVVARFDPLAGWLPAVELSRSQAGFEATEPTVDAANGRAVVVWNAFRGRVHNPATRPSRFSSFDGAMGWSPEAPVTKGPLPLRDPGYPFVRLSPEGVVMLARVGTYPTAPYQPVTETSTQSLDGPRSKAVVEWHEDMGLRGLATNGRSHQVLVDAKSQGTPTQYDQYVPRARVATMTCSVPVRSQH